MFRVWEYPVTFVVGYYWVKFYNHDAVKIMLFNGDNFEGFKSDERIHNEIEQYWPVRNTPKLVHENRTLQQRLEKAEVRNKELIADRNRYRNLSHVVGEPNVCLCGELYNSGWVCQACGLDNTDPEQVEEFIQGGIKAISWMI